ncbi:FecR domain-containing protein [Parapedobacter koreensis]|uniref:FecR family protein n=1 Tax=Parapedobacter koreensis TaxID=332977 RepID=A0A1H7SRE1_9SPHI|nr:FecR domain-containing protein [Parapedobacter koreensis]SEL75192.1 FecR family protein [Parapedobacter koreensis]
MDDILLTKYVLNETDAAEAATVRKWIAAHPDNEKYYAQFRFVWEASQRLADTNDIDEEEAWQRFVQRRDEADLRGRTSPNILRTMRWLRIAAVLTLVSVAMGLSYYLLVPSDGLLLGTTYEATNYPNTDTLADGSIITLGARASLRFSQGPLQRQRLVKLHEGEVFFNVAPDKSKPFVIHSGKVTITVLGTSFHVKHNGDETTVIVESGKVKVEGLNRMVELTADQQVTVNTQTQQFEQTARKGLVLDHTPLWRIAELLGEAYGVTIVVARGEIRDLPMTTTLRAGTLDEQLQLIAKTLGITVAKQADTIVFK